METKTKLQIAGGITVILLAGSLYHTAEIKKRDKQAAIFFSELERIIAPSSVGLVETDALDIHYWEKAKTLVKKPLIYMKQAGAQDYAKTIYDAIGYLWDNEDKIYGVFRALKDKVQTSQVAYWYFQKNKLNMIDHLRANLSTSEIDEIMKIINKQPAYRVAPSSPAPAPAKKAIKK